ncbi:MAG: hypothetical protein KKD77_21220 [Gammaproteobacteria bacterium]|nr:hypothetical protein [Gammaproteobacteria bacterium]
MESRLEAPVAADLAMGQMQSDYRPMVDAGGLVRTGGACPGIVDRRLENCTLRT